MINAVLDTNVLASWLVGRYRPESTPGGIIRAWRNGAFRLSVSEILLVELRRTLSQLSQPYFRERLTDAEIADAFVLFQREAVFISLTVAVVGVATHPEDDLVLATTASALSDYLVTGDKRLQEVAAYHGVLLLSPRALF